VRVHARMTGHAGETRVLARPSRGVLWLGVLLAVFGLAVVFAVESPGIDVVARGHFVDYTEHEVDRVRAFDAFTFLAAPETTADTDLMNSMLLAAIVGVTLLAAALTGDRRLRLFFALAAVGMVVLAIDEGFELSETIGYNMSWLDALPGLSAEKIDVLDAVPALAFAWIFRDVLLSSAAALWFWLGGLVLFFVTLALEVLAKTPVEDAVEVLASACLLVGFLVLAINRLRPEDGRT
jgi:hypothetical protein